MPTILHRFNTSRSHQRTEVIPKSTTQLAICYILEHDEGRGAVIETKGELRRIVYCPRPKRRVLLRTTRRTGSRESVRPASKQMSHKTPSAHFYITAIKYSSKKLTKDRTIRTRLTILRDQYRLGCHKLPRAQRK